MEVSVQTIFKDHKLIIMKNLLLTFYVGIFVFTGPVYAQYNMSHSGSSHTDFMTTSAIVQSDSIFEFNDFSFGGSLSSWSSENIEASLVNDKDLTFSNFSGVKLSNSSVNAQVYSFVYESVPQFTEDQTLSIYTFLPDTTNIDSVSLFLKFNEPIDSSEAIRKVTYPVKELIYNAWNRLSITVPEHQHLNQFGLQIVSKNTGGIPDFYVDLFTSKPGFRGFASISNVQNLKIDSVQKTSSTFSWDKPQVGSPEYYKIYRSTNQYSNFSVLDTTGSIFYTDPNLFSSTEYFYRVFAVDSLDREADDYVELSLITQSFPENLTWDFETGKDDWSVDDNADLQVVDTMSYSDRNALLFSASGDTTDHLLFLKRNEVRSIFPGQTVFYTMWISQNDLDKVNTIETYFSANPSGERVVKSYSGEELSANSWNKIFITIPEQIISDSLLEIGLSIEKKNLDDTVEMFIDLVTTVPNYEGVPIISAPTNFEIESLGFRQVSLQWNPSEGNGVPRYEVETLKMTGRPPFNLAKDTTLNTSITLPDLLPDTKYNFKLTGIDEHGKRTTTIEVSITTKSLDTFPVFDFETGLNGWSAGQANVSRIDTLAYSGIYSIELNTLADTSRFYISQNEEDISYSPLKVRNIQPGHILYYRLWLSEEDSKKIEGLKFWAKNGESDQVSKFIPADSLKSESWFTQEYLIPEGLLGLNMTGFDVIGKEEGVNPEVVLFIDFVSTNKEKKRSPKLTIPSILGAEIINQRFEYVLKWTKSNGEDNLVGYKIYRADSTATYIEDFELDGESSDTTFNKKFVDPGNYKLIVTAFDENGLETVPSEPFFIEIKVETSRSGESGIPAKFALHNNYPNPFNPATTFSYDIPTSIDVEISIYDITGRLIETVVNEFKSAGSYTFTFDASNLSSGMYLYRLKTNANTSVKSMILIK